MAAGNPCAMHLLALRWRHRRLFRHVNKTPLRPHMATDTPEARMPPVISRYCCCVCGKKRRTHPGVRLHLFPKDARSAIGISGDWARCGSRGRQLYHYYRKYGTQWDTNKKAPTKHHLQAAYANTANGEGGCENTTPTDSDGCKFSGPEGA
ncbi:hypothetical protein GWK47_000394 [Chionoecetes opilio]|uniref:Uncharacterized protein n=1 Tax=Chionoecetes opilio TaxID=41210 RepID=A0A8J4YFN8_CHIOP|nr:hypothetical protein GWK47_000394 [Chionoecetes opilio]